MPLIFSYGTLQRPDVQLSTFGRLLRGQRDALPQYELSRVAIVDPAVAAAAGRSHHDNATFTARPESQVRGTVFELTEAELAAADSYEQPASYARRLVTLASGKQAWIYVHAG